jgi:hypothetical protein
MLRGQQQRASATKSAMSCCERVEQISSSVGGCQMDRTSIKVDFLQMNAAANLSVCPTLG